VTTPAAGLAYVRILPDTSGFAAELNAGLARGFEASAAMVAEASKRLFGPLFGAASVAGDEAGAEAGSSMSAALEMTASAGLPAAVRPGLNAMKAEAVAAGQESGAAVASGMAEGTAAGGAATARSVSGGAAGAGALASGLRKTGLIAGVALLEGVHTTMSNQTALTNAIITDNAVGAGVGGPKLEALARKLSSQFAVPVTEAFKTVQKAVGMGVPTAQLEAFTTVTQKAALVTHTSAEDITNGVVSTLNAYNLPVAEAGRITQVLATAAIASGHSFDSMAAGVHKVDAVAAGAHISVEQLAKTLTYLGREGQDPGEAAGRLKVLIASLENSDHSPARKAMWKKVFNAKDLAGAMEEEHGDFSAVVQKIYKYSQSSGESLGSLGVLRQEMDLFEKIAQARNRLGDDPIKSSGVNLDADADKMRDTEAYKLKNALVQAQQKLADSVESSTPAIVGALSGVVTVLGDVAAGFGALPHGVQTGLIGLALAAVALKKLTELGHGLNLVMKGASRMMGLSGAAATSNAAATGTAAAAQGTAATTATAAAAASARLAAAEEAAATAGAGDAAAQTELAAAQAAVAESGAAGAAGASRWKLAAGTSKLGAAGMAVAAGAVGYLGTKAVINATGGEKGSWLTAPGRIIGGQSVSQAFGMADGGTVMPRRGGTTVTLAEASKPETVVDLGKTNQLIDQALASGGGGMVLHPGAIVIHGASDPRATATAVADELDRRRRTTGGAYGRRA